jgi:hypothetical protein
MYEFCIEISLMRFARETATFKLDILGVQKVRRDRGGTEPAGYTFFYGKGNEKHKLHTGSFYIRAVNWI